MNLLIVLGALIFLMFVAYRGYSVILFAPIAALGAVLLTDPSLVPPLFSSVFMEKMVGFVKNYFPVFMLGAVFGKVIELSGFSKSIVAAVIGVLGRERAVLSIIVVCAILTRMILYYQRTPAYVPRHCTVTEDWSMTSITSGRPVRSMC